MYVACGSVIGVHNVSNIDKNFNNPLCQNGTTKVALHKGQSTDKIEAQEFTNFNQKLIPPLYYLKR